MRYHPSRYCQGCPPLSSWKLRFRKSLEGRYPYLYPDGIVLKRSWGGEVKNVSVLAAVGAGQDGYRRILGVVEGHKEDKAGWLAFLKQLKALRGCG